MKKRRHLDAVLVQHVDVEPRHSEQVCRKFKLHGFGLCQRVVTRIQTVLIQVWSIYMQRSTF